MTTEPGQSGRLGQSGWWQCVVVGAATRPVQFALVWSDQHPDGARMSLAQHDAAVAIGDDAVCVATYDDAEQVTHLQVTPRASPKAPPLWFAEIRESTARPPAVNLLAFTGHDQASGILLDQVDVANLKVGSADQLGAVRWYPATGEVDQIYVQPQWRRQSVAGALIAAAATLSTARGWPRLWGDGQRTELGEQWRATNPWRSRAAELTHVAPPMTPPTSQPAGKPLP